MRRNAAMKGDEGGGGGGLMTLSEDSIQQVKAGSAELTVSSEASGAASPPARLLWSMTAGGDG